MDDTLLTRVVGRKLTECLESELAEGFLELLLSLMGVVFTLDRDFRRNIEGFEAAYLFRSMDGAVTVAALFHDGELEVREEEIASPTVTVTFRDAKALAHLLLAPKPDILGAMLRQEVSPEGNLNYLYKFAYLAKRLQLMATGEA
jgi:hypothetical protein